MLKSDNFAEQILGLKGKSAIVTGAGGGIGTAVCENFAGLGADVVGVDKKFPKGWAEKFGNTNPRAIPLLADVSRFESAEKAMKICVDNFGRLDILVNNAGISKGGTILDVDLADWKRIMDVNLGGYLNFAKVAAKEMVRKKRGGKIVNTSSVDGIFSEVGTIAYAAAKGAVVIFTKCLATELARFKINANSVAPGWVDTAMGTGLLKKRQVKEVSERIPMGYIAPAREIADAITFLASDLAKYVTGQTIIVDGGLTSDISIPGLVYN